ncbi:MAG: glycoside hydrolase family 26 protein [Flavobacteriaceae bacterium]
MTINMNFFGRLSLGLSLLIAMACTRQANNLSSPTSQQPETEQLNTPSTPSGSEVVLEYRNKANILAYFDQLIANKQIIVGQHCGDGLDQANDYYQEYVSRLAARTNKYVGIMGADLGFFPSLNYPIHTLVDHWNEGGLIALSWHADNPFAEGYDAYWDTVENKDAIDLKSLLRSARESKEKSSYRQEVDAIAGVLQRLKKAGITVIWRPFHEMNGDFFWWGINNYNNTATNIADFKKLWQDLYNTLTYDYDLDNLIWTYSVIPYLGWNAGVTTYYPGSDYVDLVGMDYYGQQPDFPGFNELRSLGKTIVMSEVGPKDEAYGNWNELELAYTLAGKAAYFLQWHSWSEADVAIKDNLKSNLMMNSHTVITRDELLQD